MTEAAARVLDFFVPGLPITQGSKRIVMAGKGANRRPVLIEDRDAALQRWRKAVSEGARYYMGVKAVMASEDFALIVECTFTLPRPASRAKRFAFPNKKPDVDKLARAVGDAVKGVIYGDDGQIVDFIARKRYVGHVEAESQPGVRIVVRAHVT